MWASVARTAGAVTLLAYALIGFPLIAARVAPTFHMGSSDVQGYSAATRGEFTTLLRVQHIVFDAKNEGPAGCDGWFRPASGTIFIRLRGGDSPWIDYAPLLRHEYGHALLHAWCISEGHGEAGFQEAFACRSGTTSDLPAGLAGPASEYRAQPGLFGEYSRGSLGEWMAEAFASYVSGEALPPRVRAFFDALTDRARTRTDDLTGIGLRLGHRARPAASPVGGEISACSSTKGRTRRPTGLAWTSLRPA